MLLRLMMAIYIQICIYFLANIPLHFFLATYEYFFYHTVSGYSALTKRFLELRMDSRTLMKRGEDILSMMKHLQKAFGFFLLVDLTLMLLFWLIHTYVAYFTFQVKSKLYLKNSDHTHEIGLLFQGNVITAAGSALIILAELSRVALLSNTCDRLISPHAFSRHIR